MFKFLLRFWQSRHWGLRLARMSLVIYLGLVITLMLYEEKLIYFPSRFPQGRWHILNTPPDKHRVSPVIEECWFHAADGVRLNAWYCQASQWRDDRFESIPDVPVLLWCHGNAGDITSRYEHIDFMISIPVNILIFDYRGYGKSEGIISENGLYRDTRAAWDYLIGEKEIPSRRIILFGESLGGAMAIELATQVHPAGLIVQSTFTSVPDMAKVLYPFIPAWIVRTQMNSISRIPLITCPKMIIHSPADEVVPYRLGKELFDAAPPPREFYEIPDAGHNETWLVGGHEYLAKISRFIDICRDVTK
jgi:pimeloyl-ACP methyl ester carboxylesterase